MPEIKHNFTGGKMNKDVDERLVPKGQYRDAMNIQVSTSEGSNVGTVQNILGNSPGCPDGFVSDGSFTVGSVADEKNDALYWLVSNQSYDSLANIVANANDLTNPVILSDEILRKIPPTSSNASGCERVFVDKFAFAEPNTSILNSNVLNSISPNTINEIDIGWDVTGIDSYGNYSNTAQVTAFNQNQSYFVTYGATTSSTPTIQTSYIDNPANLNAMANVVGTALYVPLNIGFVTSSTPNQNSNWAWNSGSTLMIGGWSGNISSLVGSDIMLNYNTPLAINYSVQRTITTANYIQYSYTSPSLGLQTETMVEITLDSPLPNSFNTINQGGNILPPPPPYNTNPTHWLGSAMAPISAITSVSYQLDAVISTTTTTSVNLANGNFIFDSNTPVASFQFQTNDVVNIMGSGSQNIGGSFCVSAVDVFNNSIQLSDCNTGNPVSGWQVGGMLFGSPQPTGGLVTIASQQTVTLNNDLNLSTGFDSSLTNFEALVFTGPRTLNFNHGDIVTGINIIDDMLFWTDNKTEPKKINITRSLEGTVQNGAFHTSVVNNKLNYGISPATYVPAREEHITVIKKPPTQAPRLNMVGQRLGDPYGTTNDDFTNKPSGSEITLNIAPSSGDLNYRVNDVLFLNQVPLGSSLDFTDVEFDIRVVINEINGSNYTCNVLSVTEGILGGPQNYNVNLDISGEKLYSLKFPRFAIRYKYEDGEYSSYGPFSEVAFIPGEFGIGKTNQFLPNRGYNLGMENKLKELDITNIIQDDLPFDVVQVDIIYKESDSPNVYTVDEIKPTDQYWLDNSYEILEETIKALLPSNQLLRPFDNVPKKALAQEITGNRIVYGNYEQGYDLGDFRANFNVRIKERFDTFTKKSIKSLRKYQLGVVYCDEYNRQTPVLSDSTGSLRVERFDSDKRSQIEVLTNHIHPFWATHYKFYLKETSTEYYNLSLDRHYDAEDDNIWLAFPSNDRNKLDLETSLYLKKRYNSSEKEISNAKYKVIDIKNEAPEYIKTRRVVLGRQQDNSSGTDLFDQNDFLPVPNQQEIKIKEATFNDTLLEDFHENQTIAGSAGGSIVPNSLQIKILKVNASGDFLGDQTQWYEIDNVKRSGGYYYIKLKDKFNQGDDWIVNDALPPYTTSSLINITTNTEGLAVEIGQDIVQNKSIFQGRFFAKILKDEFAQEAIIEQGIIQNQVVIASAKVGRLTDFNSARPTGVSSNYKNQIKGVIDDFNANGFPWSAGQSPSVPDGPGGQVDNNAYWSYEAWKKIQQQLDGVNSRWVLDEAFSAGQDVLWQSSGGSAASELNPAAGGSSLYGGTNYSNSNPLAREFNEKSVLSWMPTNNEAYQNGLAHGSNQANYEYSSTGGGLNTNQNTFDISYIGPGRRINDETLFSTYGLNALSIDSTNDVWPNFWSIDSDFDPTAKAFADELKIGAYIRFNNDPNLDVWKIKKVKKYYKWNYTDGVGDVNYPDFNISNSSNTSHELALFATQPQTNQSLFVNKFFNEAYFNRRVTYRITVELVSTPNATIGYQNYFPWDTDATTISTNLCPIDIISLDYIDDNNEIPFPNNPAIFETEPKEDVDLNIYHEASDTIPLSLAKNGNQFAPSGSSIISLNIQAALTTSPQYQNVAGDQVVNLQTTASGAPVEVVSWQENNVVEANEAFLDPLPGDTFTFNRPDGTYTVAAFVQLEEPIVATAFGNESNFATFNIVNKVGLGWHNCYSFGNGVESNRVRDAFNAVFIDKGPKVSATLDEGYELEKRKHGLIYSGLYNSTSGVNNLNQFIQAEKITKDVNPIYGSIQRIHSRDSDLVTLCEDKILKILSNKDAVFNADGNTNLTATSKVLGQTIPFVGEYGISKNPESFASESYRAYFTDKVRGAVMRLSMDGLTPISDHGMKDYFRDNLKLNNKLVGSYDDKKDEYNITLEQTVKTIPTTVSFKEDVKGWVSFKSFVPENAISCANEYYTFKSGKVYKHHDEDQDRNTFYNNALVPTSITVVLNEAPGTIKDFYTINYEGSQGFMNQNTNYNTFDKNSWDGTFNSSGEPNYTSVTSNITASQTSGYNLQSLNSETGWFVNKIETDKEEGSIKEFVEKEGKWFNYIKGKEWL